MSDIKGNPMSNLVRAQRIPKPAAAEQSLPKQSEFRRVARLMGRFMAGHRRQFVMAGLMLIIDGDLPPGRYRAQEMSEEPESS